MTAKRTTASLLLFAFVLLFAAAGGCKGTGGDPVDVSSSPSPAPSVTASAEAPTPDPAVSTGNEVFDMLTRFFAEYGAASSGIIEAVYASGDRALMTECFQMLDDEAYVALVFGSVGMLAFDEQTYYCSGTVSGAYAGSGYMLPGGEFEYDFESGGSVSGFVTDARHIEAYFKNGDQGVTVTVSRFGDGYVFLVKSGSFTGICEVRSGYLRYGRFPSSQVFDVGNDGFPDIAEANILIYADGAVSISE